MNEETSLLKILESNLPAIITGLTAIFTAITTGFFTWLLSHRQYKMKEMELVGQFEFRGREHLFNSFQIKIESRHKSGENFFNEIGKAYGQIMAYKEEERGEYFKTILGFFKKILFTFKDLVEEYRIALIDEELLDEGNTKRLESLSDILKRFQREFNPSEYEDRYFDLIKLAKIIKEIDSDLLENKSKKLFSKYI